MAISDMVSYVLCIMSATIALILNVGAVADDVSAGVDSGTARAASEDPPSARGPRGGADEPPVVPIGLDACRQ